MQEYDKENTNYGPAAIAPLYWQSWCTEKKIKKLLKLLYDESVAIKSFNVALKFYY